LEVILSLAILVMSLTAIGVLINMGSEHEMQARLQNAGTRLAQSKLSEVEAGIAPLEEGTGDFGENEPGWNWSIQAEDQGLNLWLVSVTVSREYRGTTIQISLTQMMLDPAYRGSAAKLSRPSTETTDTTTDPPGGNP
jgi:hypothetical protein